MSKILYGEGLQAELLGLAHEISAHEMAFNGLISAGQVNWSSPDRSLALSPVQLASPAGDFRVESASFVSDAGDTRLTVHNTKRGPASIKEGDVFARHFYDTFSTWLTRHLETDHSHCEEKVKQRRVEREKRLFGRRSFSTGEVIN